MHDRSVRDLDAARSQLRILNPATCALVVLVELLVVQMSGRSLGHLCVCVLPADGIHE